MRCGAAQNRIWSIVFIERLEDDNFVTGIDDRHHGGHHRFGRATADGDLALGVVLHALGALKFFDNGVAQRLRAPGYGVLVDVIGDGSARGFLDFLRRGKVGKPLGQIDGPMLQGQACHFPDNGFRELFGLGRKHAAGDFCHREVGSSHCTFSEP